MTQPASDSIGARLVSGDESAIEDCYRNYGPAVRSYLRRFVPEGEVDDLLQLSFFDLWRTRGRFDPARPIEPWLFTIARRRAITYLRSQSLVVEAAAARDLVGEDGDRVVEEMAWAAEIHRAVSRLSTDQSEAIKLVFFDQLTQREAAARLGIPLGTVKARIWRALRYLGRQLEGGSP